MTPPVLFLIFNRPRHTERVFDAIRRARPTRLYVAADGPRASRAGELALCEETRRIATRVDWDCDLKTLFRPENLGCRNAVSRAIDWFFEHEAEGIILEDDCLPHPTFFRFCEELLEHYRDDPRIMSVCGSNFAWPHFARASYYFSRYADIWGWASWRRAWAHYDVDMTTWPRTDVEKMVSGLFADHPHVVHHWASHFAATYARKVDTWDFQWIYAVMKHGGYAVYPTVNLISNLGFGPDATHTLDQGRLASRRTLPMPRDLRHPDKIETIPYVEADIMKYRHGVPRAPANLGRRVLRKCREKLLQVHPHFDLA